MKAYFLLFLTCLLSLVSAQNNRGRWTDLFSYAGIKKLQEVNGVLYSATQNGIFLYDEQQSQTEWVKYNKTNILNHVDITAINYNQAHDVLIVGYKNGSIDLLSSIGTQQILDIPWNSLSGSKEVRSIYFHGDYAYFTGNYGIVSFDLKKKEFVETTFFFKAGGYYKANDMLINNGVIYVATDDGIYYNELVNGVNFPNFNQWKLIDSTRGEIGQIEWFNDRVYFSHWNNIHYLDTSLNSISVKKLSTWVRDLKVTDNQLIITQDNKVSTLSRDGVLKDYEIAYQDVDDKGVSITKAMEFNSAISFKGKLYGGSALFGLIELEKPAHYLEDPKGLMPDGPYSNASWSLATQNGKVWIAPGAMQDYNAPSENRDGFSYFDALQWKHFSRTKDLGNAYDIVHIAVNPMNDDHFIASSYYDHDKIENISKGIFEVEGKDRSFTITNIHAQLPKLLRIAGSTFDEEGNVYVSQSFGKNGTVITDNINHLAVRKGKNWSSVKRTNDNASTALAPYIGQNYIWIPQARAGGVAVLNKTTYEVEEVLRKGNASLPDDGVLSIAMDQSNTLWIGTIQGLVLLRGADEAIKTGNVKTEPIVIMQAGIPEALLTNVRINKIEVDKANRKWVATHASGAYYFSENGEQTIAHFTTKNSPLPSDIIYDIKVDSSTGIVYFATEKGVVAYRGDVKEIGEDFSEAMVYPNPVRPGFKGRVTIKGVPNRAIVKITDVVGNLIYETVSAGGIAEWDTNNSKGKAVASGIYFALMSNQDGTETKTLKIAVVR